jgi:PAS domain S-box-containing protein
VRGETLKGRDRWPRVGRFRYITRDDRWEWSNELARIYGYEPGRVKPTTELLLTHKHPDDRALLADLIDRVRRYGMAFGNRFRIVDTRGDERVVVVLGNPLLDGHGKMAGAAGFYVDITEQFHADVQKRLTESVTEVSERRAVINQALGILMLRYGINADDAFGLLTKLSQESNTKLRIIAEHLVAEIAPQDESRDDAAERVERVLRAARAAGG